MKARAPSSSDLGPNNHAAPTTARAATITRRPLKGDRYDGPRLQAGLCVHRFEEVGVALGVAQLVEQKVDGIHRAHRIQDAAQDIHLLELIGCDEKLFLARTRAGDI